MSDKRPDFYDDEIDLMEVFGVLWRRKWLILLVTMVCFVGAMVYVAMQPKIYRAIVTINPFLVEYYLDDEINIKREFVPDLEKLQAAVNGGNFDFDFARDKIEMSDITIKASVDKNSDLRVEIDSSDINKLRSVSVLIGELIKRSVNDDFLKFEHKFNRQIEARDKRLAEVDSEMRAINRQIEIEMLVIEKHKKQIVQTKAKLEYFDKRNAYIGQIITKAAQDASTILKKELFENDLTVADLNLDISMSELEMREAMLNIENLKEERDYTLPRKKADILAEYVKYEKGFKVVEPFDVTVSGAADIVQAGPNIKRSAMLSLIVGMMLAIFLVFVVAFIKNSRMNDE